MARRKRSKKERRAIAAKHKAHGLDITVSKTKSRSKDYGDIF